jgi:hypothetical protein
MNRVAPGSNHLPPPAAGRVARSMESGETEVGAEGGSLSSDLTRSIKASRGMAMPADVRSTMESGFGADFSGVRVHDDSPAASKIQARAFTHGNDIHFAPGQFQPDNGGGQHLIAHELAHVVQQRGVVNRRMWDQARFDKETNERLARKSTAQKQIRVLLEAYGREFRGGMLDEPTAKKAYSAVEDMQLIARAYIDKNEISTGAGGTGDKVTRSKRSNRIAGMKAFEQACIAEKGSLLRLFIDRGKADEDKWDQTVERGSGIDVVLEHYATGDANSCFRKLGKLIEMAVPAAGDKASINLQVKIPVSPGVFVNLGLGAETSRGERQANHDPTATQVMTPASVKLNVSAGVSGNVGSAAEVAGALGGYIEARAQTGADAAELLSYALFRRGRSSKAIPREVVNFMWGEGNSDAFGWQVAEMWSLGVEQRILESYMTGTEEKNENYVETGGFGKVSGSVGVDKVAKIEGAAQAYMGTRIDATSLKARKGGAGEANRRSGKVAGLGHGERMSSQASTRGVAQKNVGRTTRGFKLSAAAGNDMLKGGLEFAMRWISDGKHGVKTYDLAEATIGGSFGFTMPADEIIGGGLGNLIPTVVESVNRMIANSKMKAAQEEETNPRQLGNVVNSLDSGATAIAMLAKAEDAWKPPTKLAESSSGFSSSTTYTLGVEFDIKNKEMSITLSQDKTSEAAKIATDVTKGAAVGVKVEMAKSSRLLAVKYDGTKWTPKWAGSMP